LPTLWRRVVASEDSRVQEKAWAAIIEILCRACNLELLQQWDRLLMEARQGPRRLQLLNEAFTRWQKREELKTAVATVRETLVQALLEQGKWAAATPLIREMLTLPISETDQEKCLRWLLTAGQQALKEGNRPEALQAAQQAQAYLRRKPSLAAEFEKLERSAKEP
jgi:hypothetical protein